VSNISEFIVAVEEAIGEAREAASCASEARDHAEEAVSLLENLLSDMRDMCDLDEANERMRGALNQIRNVMEELGDF
jgi:methyl-accepting chemotaxis protein